MIPELVDHLWQSTLLVGAAWLLTLALRKNRAQVRYWVWFTASVKFLAPLALLVTVGELAPRHVARPMVRTEWVVVAQQISEPSIDLPDVGGTANRARRDLLAPVALAVWACGFLGVAICWLARWRRVGALRRLAAPVGGIEFPVPVMSVPGLVEPGVFGIFQAVLLLPEGIAERLSPAQLAAILAHEFCHVRRKDNLTATIHMIVQAIFWFHPLVWWLGARLIDERERACDEEVLRLGSKPQVYAEGILNVCKLYVESPLACVSGVTGSNLKRRIEAIMKNRSVLRLSFGKKAALAVAGIAVVAAPIAIGILHAQPAPTPKYEVAAIRPCEPAPDVPGRRGGGVGVTPGRLSVNCMPVMFLIQSAYVSRANAILKPFDSVPISGGPAWLKSDRYDIEAKAESNPSAQVMEGPMLQALLEDRFKLKIRHETKEIPVYELTIAKSGFKLQPMKDGDCTPFDPLKPPDFTKTPVEILAGCGVVRYGPPRGERPAFVEYHGMSLDEISGNLVQVLDRPVINKTGVSGIFHFHVEFAPDGTIPKFAPAVPDDPPGGASIFTAFQEQLGLKLEPAKAPGEFLVIDSVERPSEN
jgi:bla regulator protein BlaR1